MAASPELGQPPAADLFAADGLHLNSKGYEIWNDAVTSALEQAAFRPKTVPENPLHPHPGSHIFIDFGPSSQGDGEHTASPDGNGNHWNNWHPVSASPNGGSLSILPGQSVGNLFTTKGRETGIDLVVTGEFSTAGRRDGGLVAPDTALLGDFAVATATEDYFWAGSSETFGGIQTGGFMLTGLDPSLSYDLRFFGTRRGRNEWSTEYRIFGRGESITSLLTSGRDIGGDGRYDGNDSEIAIAHGVQSDEFGQIFIDVNGQGDHRTYLGIMEITVVAALGDCNRDGVLNATDLSCVSSIEARDAVLDCWHRATTIQFAKHPSPWKMASWAMTVPTNLSDFEKP